MLGHNKPFSEACERNKTPILQFLRQWLIADDKVLEIGSGSGQHGVFFAQQLPNIIWQCSERSEKLAGLQQWIEEADLQNLPSPLVIDVNTYIWNSLQYQAVFSANTLHIMSWPTVEHFLQQVKQALCAGGKLILYGPFCYHGAYTSAGNEQLDRCLRESDEHSGIRDMEAIAAILQEQGFVLVKDQSMPANNQLLLWQLAQ